MRFIKTAATTMLVGLMLVIGVDYVALAATGQSMVLGKTNKANQTTTVKNTGSGPAAKFVADDAPIAVNNDSLIKKLNADLVDGKHATDLGVSTRLYKSEFGLEDVSGFQIHIPDVPAGSYFGTYSGYFLGPNTGGTISCFVVNTQAPVNEWMADLQPADGDGIYYPLHGADVIVLPTKQDLIARCTGSGGDWGGDIRIGLTRINHITKTTLPAGPA